MSRRSVNKKSSFRQVDSGHLLNDRVHRKRMGVGLVAGRVAQILPGPALVDFRIPQGALVLPMVPPGGSIDKMILN